MTSVKFNRHNNRNSHKKHECSADSVIDELKQKMSRLKFRLLDCQNQNQMLRKELLLAKKVITTEVSKAPDEKFLDLLNQSEFQGRQEKILILKDKLNELQNRIKELEDGNAERSSEDLPKPSKVEKLEAHKIYQNKKMMDKELQYLLENSCQMKRKIEVWKKRNAELNKEVDLLRLELDRLLEKSKEDKNVHESYKEVDKELRARQSEKLDMRSKLDIEKTRNEQLTEELGVLKDDLSMILSKINDDKVLTDALKSQEGYLVDLLERQKLILENDSRKFQDDMREIEIKHATNRHVLDHLKDIVQEKTKICQQVQKVLEQKSLVEEKDDQESTATIMTNSDVTSQNESQQSAAPTDEPPSQSAEAPVENEILNLKEEIEQYKNIFLSVNEEVEQLTGIILSNNKKANEWNAQLLQTNSLLAQKNAEIRDLENTAKKLQKSLDKKESISTSQSPNFTDEFQKKSDALTEEYHFLCVLWDLLISNKENSLEVFLISGECARKLFSEAISNLISQEDDLGEEERLPQSENNELPTDT